MVKLPSKALEGRRIQLLRTTSVDSEIKPGDRGTVTAVNTETGDVAVSIENDGPTVLLNWEAGDRWAIATSAKPYSS
jgi:hypothetical protein